MKKRHRNEGVSKVCGCARKRWSKCRHPWHFNFKLPGGTSYRFSLSKHFKRKIESRTEAEDLAADLRKQIRAGTFGQTVPRDEMTLRQLADLYIERHVTEERPKSLTQSKWVWNSILATPVVRPVGGATAPLGEWRHVDVVTDTIERFRQARRAKGTGLVGTNRHLGELRALFNWAIRMGYAERTPFVRQGVAVVKLKAGPSRTRRLNRDIDEETKLLAACNQHLRSVVEAALETGMRRGEILKLQWSQVLGLTVEAQRDGSHKTTWLPRPRVVLPWTKTKTKTTREIPISSRLQGILEMRRFDPAGHPHEPTAYVFGNRIGQRVRDIGRAWESAVLKAHSHQPKTTKTCNLTPECRKRLAEIDLHFHDLRREAGSRWLEGGVPLHTVRDWLGHTSIKQTDTYLSGTTKTQHEAMDAYEMRMGRVRNEIGTKDGNRGTGRLRSDARGDEKPRKHTNGHNSATM